MLFGSRLIGIKGHDPDQLPARQGEALLEGTPQTRMIAASCHRAASLDVYWILCADLRGNDIKYSCNKHEVAACIVEYPQGT